MKKYIIIVLLGISGLTCYCQNITGWFSSSYMDNNNNITEKLEFYNNKFMYSYFVNGRSMGFCTGTYMFYNDSVFVINSENNRTKITESKKKKEQRFVFTVLPNNFPAAHSFKNLNLYIVTGNNDTLLIKESERESILINVYYVKKDTNIKCFWFEDDNMKTEQYSVKSTKSNIFNIYLYTGKLFENDYITIVNKDTIRLNSTHTIFHRESSALVLLSDKICIFVERDYNEPHKFTGYERDNESGLDYAHARYRNINFGFISTDPMWWKYPHLSSYAYAGNNPIMRTDPTGMDIWLGFYDKNGKQDGPLLRYTPGMQYDGDNVFFARSVAILNKMNSVKNGSTVLSALSSSSTDHFYTNLVPHENAGAAAAPQPNGDVYYYMYGDQSLRNTAHELFHGFQSDNSFYIPTDQNEVEAYLFGISVAWNYAMSNLSDDESQRVFNSSNFDFSNNNMLFGNMFNSAFNALLNSDGTSDLNLQDNYNTAISTFRIGSSFNFERIYNGNGIFPIRKSLIFQFMPLINE